MLPPGPKTSLEKETSSNSNSTTKRIKRTKTIFDCGINRLKPEVGPAKGHPLNSNPQVAFARGPLHDGDKVTEEPKKFVFSSKINGDDDSNLLYEQMASGKRRMLSGPLQPSLGKDTSRDPSSEVAERPSNGDDNSNDEPDERMESETRRMLSGNSQPSFDKDTSHDLSSEVAERPSNIAHNQDHQPYQILRARKRQRLSAYPSTRGNRRSYAGKKSSRSVHSGEWRRGMSFQEMRDGVR